MSGNAHRNRAKKRSTPCRTGCLFCLYRPEEGKSRGLFRNTNGNRRNPARKKRGRRNKAANVVVKKK